MYEIGLSKTFVAWHVMPGVDGPEGELHTHDYRLEVVVSRGDLDERGMVCDLDVLDVALEKVVGVVAGQNLDIIRPAHAEAVTVEVLSRWAHGALSAELATAVDLAVRVWESPVAFGGYAAPTSSS
ncbi:MAG TPA: 6-carboxytetrahydropterin synthase [Actinomycetota bacterium]|nr:6-carboxytetrahydropterin synthase [Actinomycetota bacterium]